MVRKQDSTTAPGLLPEHWMDGGDMPADLEPGERAAYATDVMLRQLRGMRTQQLPLEAVAVSWKAACAFVEHVHRHLPPAQGWKYGCGLRDSISLVGVVMVGRPVARHLDDGATLEVTRCAIMEGAARNAASQLLGQAARAARAMGYTRLVSYVLEDETGASLRAAGWSPDGAATGGGVGGRRGPSAGGAKTRWAVAL